MNKSPFLAVAREAAEAAAQVLRHYWKRDVDVETKQDLSPVTVADREAEQAIHAIIRSAFPDHAFFGEEFGRSGESDYEWLVDPLDGTKSFIRRQPFFSTQIALRHRGQVLVAVSSAPMFGEMAWACAGEGAFLDGERLQVSRISQLEAASLSAGNIGSLAADDDAWRRYGELLRRVNRVRGYGDFCHYHMLARGALDVVIESDLNILDVAALSLIVEEAGGRFTTLSGGVLNDSCHSVLATNGILHEEICCWFEWKD